MLLSGLDLRLAAAAQEAGLDDAMNVTAAVLWYSYAAFLVRQGIDRESLIARVGPIPPQVQSSLMALAPAGGNAADGEVRLIHPALSGHR